MNLAKMQGLAIIKIWEEDGIRIDKWDEGSRYIYISVPKLIKSNCKTINDRTAEEYVKDSQRLLDTLCGENKLILKYKIREHE